MPGEPEKRAEGTTLHEKMQPQDMPRERLIRCGRTSLSDEELIAIFLRTGIHGRNVLEMAQQIKEEAGSLEQLGRMEAVDIMQQCKGIGPAKAATLAAAFELGMRAVHEEIRPTSITMAEDVYRYFSGGLRFTTQEGMHVLLLDAHNHLIRCVQTGLGTLTRVIAHARDIFRDAVRYSASRIILVHNHPSGDPTPSQMDRELTAEVAKAGEVLRIPLADHIVIGSPRKEGGSPFFSFREHGLL